MGPPGARISTPLVSPPSAESRRRQLIVMLGLLLTFAGLAGLFLTLPLQAPEFPGDLRPFAVGLIGLFAGGLLMGFGLGRRRPGSR